jgi:hypothetical protein
MATNKFFFSPLWSPTKVKMHDTDIKSFGCPDGFHWPHSYNIQNRICVSTLEMSPSFVQSCSCISCYFFFFWTTRIRRRGCSLNQSRVRILCLIQKVRFSHVAFELVMPFLFIEEKFLNILNSFYLHMFEYLHFLISWYSYSSFCLPVHFDMLIPSICSLRHHLFSVDLMLHCVSPSHACLYILQIFFTSMLCQFLYHILCRLGSHLQFSNHFCVSYHILQVAL